MAIVSSFKLPTKLPTSSGSGYGMGSAASASAINKMAAASTAPRPTTSSFGLSSAPKAAASSSNWQMPAPSWSTGSSSSSGYPSLSNLSKPSATSYPSLSSAAARSLTTPAKTQLGQASPLTNYFSSGSSSKPATSSAPAPSWQMPAPSWSTGPNAAPISARTSPLQMPSGFSSGAFAQSTAQQPKQAPAGSAPSSPGSRLSASGAAAAAAKGYTQNPQDHTKSSSGGVEYVAPTGGKQVHASVTGPGAPKVGVPSAQSKTFTDQYGRTMYYNDNGTGQGQPIAGVSAEGTVLRTVMNSNGTPYMDKDGKPVVYDTGSAAFQPAAPRSAPAAPVAVGPRTGVPQAVPVVRTQAPPAAPPPRQPTQDEIDSANQGRWLG